MKSRNLPVQSTSTQQEWSRRQAVRNQTRPRGTRRSRGSSQGCTSLRSSRRRSVERAGWTSAARAAAGSRYTTRREPPGPCSVPLRAALDFGSRSFADVRLLQAEVPADLGDAHRRNHLRHVLSLFFLPLFPIVFAANPSVGRSVGISACPPLAQEPRGKSRKMLTKTVRNTTCKLGTARTRSTFPSGGTCPAFTSCSRAKSRTAPGASCRATSSRRNAAARRGHLS